MKIINLNAAQRQGLQLILSRFRKYKTFSANKKAAYKYASVFEISVCPYCNIHYIDTVAAVTRPEFDHFICKSSKLGGDIQLDSRNLVPSCHICNSTIKKNKIFKCDTHINPLYHDFDSIMKFYIDIKDASYLNTENFDICFGKKCSDNHLVRMASNSVRDLKLVARYQCCKHYVVEYLKLIRHYNSFHRKMIFDLIGVNSHQVYSAESLLCGYIDIDINNTSLGKLRKDIISSYAW